MRETENRENRVISENERHVLEKAYDASFRYLARNSEACWLFKDWPLKGKENWTEKINDGSIKDLRIFVHSLWKDDSIESESDFTWFKLLEFIELKDVLKGIC